MSQQHQVMLQGDHRGRRILIAILLLVICAVLLEAWKPGTLHTIVSSVYDAIILLFGYARSLVQSLRELL